MAAGHDHHHGHHGHHHHGVAANRAGARHGGALFASLLLVVAFLAVQVVVGLVTGSLALLSDAGHMATDAIGLGMALAAIRVGQRIDHDPQRTFGLYRLEILAALVNAALLLGVAGYVIIEASRRAGNTPDVPSGPVLAVGIAGLVVNLVAFALLRAGARESLNVRGAYLEVVADAIGSVGVIVAALVWGITGWGWVDPVAGAALGVFVVPRAWRLGAEALRVLVQAAPRGVDVAALRGDLAAVNGVVDVHDLHVWTLTSDMEVATAHLMVTVGTDTHRVLDEAREVISGRHGIVHATLQVEPDDHRGCDEIDW